MNPVSVRVGVGAAGWALAAVVGARALMFVGNLVLARLLTPNVFGVVGLALVATSTVGLFQDLGIGKALVRDHGAEEPAASTAFTVIVAVALVLGSLLFLGAGSVARILGGAENLESAIRLVSPLPILVALGAVPSTLLERRLHYRRRTLLEWGPALAFLVVGVTAAVMGGRVVALISAHLAAAVVAAVLGFKLSGFTPRFRLHRHSVQGLFNFARWVMLASLAAFIFLSVDRLWIGRVLGSEKLGFYLLAFGIANLPTSILSNASGRVALSAFSQLEREERPLKDAYLRSLSFMAWLAIPFCGLLGWLGPRLVSIVYGDHWAPAASLLPILAVYAFFRTVGGLSGSIFLARGRSRLFFFVNLLQLASLSALFFVGTPTLVAVAWIFSGGIALGAVSALSLSFRLVEVSQREGWSAFFPALRAGLATAAILLGAGAMGLSHTLGGAVVTATGAVAFHLFLFARSRVVVLLRSRLSCPETKWRQAA